MKSEVIVRRYAEGFIAFAKETLGVEAALEELKNLKTILRENADLKLFFEAPDISFLDKKKSIEKIFQETFSSQLKDFLYLLAQKRRLDLLSEIIDYLRKTYSHQDAWDALLQVSSPLDLEVLQSIQRSGEKRIGHRLKMFVHLDPELLGGVRLTVGNRVFDGSVSGALGELRERLRELRVS